METLVNMTVHELTEEQKQTAKELGVVSFMEYKDLYPDLFKQVSNSPDNSDELDSLAVRVVNSMNAILAEHKNVFFHLPFGSPAFNFALSKWIWFAKKNGIYKGKILFSHSERVSREITLPDGSVKKESVFSFKKFIRF